MLHYENFGVRFFFNKKDKLVTMQMVNSDVVKTVTHETVSQEDLGGASVHAVKSGVAHLSFKTEISLLVISNIITIKY